MSRVRAVTRALVEALERPTGSVSNGRLLRPPRRPPLPGRSGFSDVVVKQPPAGRWACDGCEKHGVGGLPLLEHARETAHRSYTAR